MKLSSLRLFAAVTLTALCAGLVPIAVKAATADAMFELHPFCMQREGETDDWVLGPIPAVGMIADTRGPSTRCTTFEVRDPQTLQTKEHRKGDTVSIDILIDNPSRQNIRRARAWLSYDPEILEGTEVKIDRKFALVTPDEETFSQSKGYVKMEAMSEGSGPDGKKLLFATVRFKVLQEIAAGTPITFHDVGAAGHTLIEAVEGEGAAYIQKAEPGTLLVRFGQEIVGQEDENDDDDSGSLFDALGASVPDVSPLLPNSAACNLDSECSSRVCGSGICVPDLGDRGQEDNGGRTAFSLLQIRNLRATTDGSSIFLAWDHLRSSQLKAYNVYYGTVSGRYVQRRTIDKGENSTTLRNLLDGETYYLALRGLSTQDEESAFSREVSVTVGNPNSSTAPLLQGSFIPTGAGGNPLSTNGGGGAITVPGETGAPSIAVLLFVLCAVVGTIFASRRQLSISTKPPRS